MENELVCSVLIDELRSNDVKGTRVQDVRCSKDAVCFRVEKVSMLTYLVYAYCEEHADMVQRIRHLEMAQSGAYVLTKTSAGLYLMTPVE